MPTAVEDVDEDSKHKEKEKNKDPVIQEYDVYLTTPLLQQLYLLQYPNRARDHTFVRHAYPESMRMKPTSGFMEMDLPVHFTNFDKLRGLKWGEALQELKEEGSAGLGIAGGFGGPSGRMTGLRARKPKSEAATTTIEGANAATDIGGDVEGLEDESELIQSLENFDESVKRGRVLNKQTLGGQILKYEEGQPIYMLGAFREKELHLTRINGLVQMRPQFHHIDASNRIAASARRRAETSQQPVPSTEARAVFESLKTAEQDDISTTNLANFLQRARDEQWTDLKYFHEDTEEAYDAYFGSLLVDEPSNAAMLKSDMDNVEYLDAISAERIDPSGRTKKKPMTGQQMSQVDLSESESEQIVGSDINRATAAEERGSSGKKTKGRV